MGLSDKYTLERGAVYLTGIQALVRLPVEQMRRDRRAGLNTGAFISGYEGSPLGGYDLALMRERKLLEEHGIHFVPGVNEDLAATAVMGSQIHRVIGKSKVDGVVGFWYGKGPGVDRSGDVLRHANLAGTGTKCAAIVLAGDDHTAKSSTIPHQSDFSFLNVGIPFFYPGNTQEILDYGLLAVALSRWSGAWIGMKLVTDICDGGGTVIVDPELPAIRLPDGYEKYTDARTVSPISRALEYETHVRRMEAARMFAQANQVNVFSGARDGAKIGLLSSGKPYYDLIQALRDLGIGREDLAALGIRLGKIGMQFPLDPQFAMEFADGLSTILVIEEKRSFLELQLRSILYGRVGGPAILGKEDAGGAPLLPATGELDPDMIAPVVARLLHRKYEPVQTPARFPDSLPVRAAAFCSGCPHNRSTLILEGQIAGGGIGCHTMAIRLDDPTREVKFVTQMGGEGAPWIGMAPFTEHEHIFQNIGDGTLFHSGYLAIEACVAADVNITFKILHNGHVAMTGGQMAAGAIPIPELTRKLEAEGVKKIVVLAEDTGRYKALHPLAGDAELRDRSALETTLAELAQIPGVTVLIYDQQCAAEKRRQRSRGKLAEPVKRLVIHEEVCEGCGDCVRQSNCMSLTPVETPLGQKMRIHQASCNKDYSCALGDCPSFVTVKIKPGTGLRKKTLPELPAADVRPPRVQARAGNGYRVIAPGIGGTGVVTVNALLATAAWIDGLHVATLDQTGTAQKGGAVVSHLLISENPIDVPAKVNAGNADLILGFDLLGVAAPENLIAARSDRTVAVVNTDISPTIDTIRGRTVLSPQAEMLDLVNASTGRGRNIFVDASRIAEGLFGSHLAVNLFLAGIAFQAGLLPVSLDSMEKSIEWNGVEVLKNQQVFLWGRKYYEDPAFVEAQTAGKPASSRDFDRTAELQAYQNEQYAAQYLEFVERISQPDLRAVVERYLYKLMAYKDEYEVARLLTRPEFERNVRETWESAESVSYNLHPPLLRGVGLSNKIEFGPWFRFPLRLLSRMKPLRGTAFDIFGYSAHRREERALIGWYRGLIEKIAGGLTPENLPQALEIAALPDQIRGYERIKEESIRRVKSLAAEKLTAFSGRVGQPV
ncbi:MAG: indolepyruvate ferredoxin oxidoreductase family protein [Bryobacteraceae bacterium]